jgi:hypothetical protein
MPARLIVRKFRPRFTIRGLMVSVAVVGIFPGLMVGRSRQFLARAAEYQEKSDEILRELRRDDPTACPHTFQQMCYRRIALNCRKSARHPWRFDRLPDPLSVK